MTDIFDHVDIPRMTVDPSAPDLDVTDGCIVVSYGSEEHRLTADESRRLAQRVLRGQKPQKQQVAGYCVERHGRAASSRCKKRQGHGGKHRAGDKFEW